MPRSPKKKTPKVARPPFERMQRIHQALLNRQYPNCTDLSEMMGVSKKTMHRDIDFMRDRQGLPIGFDQRRNGYYYTQAVKSGAMLQVTEAEVMALFVARKVLDQYKGTKFEEPLARAFEKLTVGLQDTISFPLGDIDERISIGDVSKAKHRVRIRFDSFASHLVLERKWHESQRIKKLPDEEIEVTMTLNSFCEVERWILSWGPHARVIEPVELREQVLAKAKAIVAAYS